MAEALQRRLLDLTNTLTGDPEMDERIQEAADSCPVEVIEVERD